MKVHISLEPDCCADAGGRAAIRERIESVCSLSQVDVRRFERHGLLTAELADAADIERIRAIPGVAAVEPDEQRRAL